MATWQHGKFNTSQLRNLWIYNDETLHVWIRPLGVAPRIREIYTSCDFSSFLPSSLFFLRTCTGQTDRDNFTHNGSKDAVWRKEVLSQQVFFSILTFWGSFCPQTPKISPPVGKSQPNKKSRITSKPFKVDKKCQLNMNIKSGSLFQNPRSEITWSAP